MAVRKGLDVGFSRSRLRVLGILALVVAVAAGVYLASGLLVAPSGEEVRGVVEQEPVIQWRGETYTRRKRTQTLLFMGVDRQDDAAPASSFTRSGVQADFLFMLVIDDDADTVRSVHIDRDTMAEIGVTNIMGKPSGSTVAQICLAYAFGSAPEQSCQMTVQAVSGLFEDIDIDHYMSLNMGDIAAINDAVGGVTVRIDEDLTALNPKWKPGAVVTLLGQEAESFVRARYSVGFGTNAERMVRQREYLSGFREALLAGLGAGGESYLERLLNVTEAVAEKDMTDQWLLDKLWQTRDYDWPEIETVAGEHIVGESGFMEYHADVKSIEELIVNLYFKPVNGA